MASSGCCCAAAACTGGASTTGSGATTPAAPAAPLCCAATHAGGWPWLALGPVPMSSKKSQPWKSSPRSLPPCGSKPGQPPGSPRGSGPLIGGCSVEMCVKLLSGRLQGVHACQGRQVAESSGKQRKQVAAAGSSGRRRRRAVAAAGAQSCGFGKCTIAICRRFHRAGRGCWSRLPSTHLASRSHECVAATHWASLAADADECLRGDQDEATSPLPRCRQTCGRRSSARRGDRVLADHDRPPAAAGVPGCVIAQPRPRSLAKRARANAASPCTASTPSPPWPRAAAGSAAMLLLQAPLDPRQAAG